MKNIRKTLEKAHRVLYEAGIDHALIGGLALGHLGVHRATMDIDLLVDGNSREIIKRTLEANGFNLHFETQEVMHFTGDIHIDVLLANRTPTRMMLKRAAPIRELDIKCLCAEDIIGLKIQAYVNNPKRALQDKADIVAVMQKNQSLDWERIKSYADIFNEWPTIEALRKDYEL